MTVTIVIVIGVVTVGAVRVLITGKAGLVVATLVFAKDRPVGCTKMAHSPEATEPQIAEIAAAATGLVLALVVIETSTLNVRSFSRSTG